MSAAIDRPGYLPVAAINAERLADQVLDEIDRGVAGPDALFAALGGIDNEAGRRAFLRRLQKSLEVGNELA